MLYGKIAASESGAAKNGDWLLHPLGYIQYPSYGKIAHHDLVATLDAKLLCNHMTNCSLSVLTSLCYTALTPSHISQVKALPEGAWHVFHIGPIFWTLWWGVNHRTLLIVPSHTGSIHLPLLGQNREGTSSNKLAEHVTGRHLTKTRKKEKLCPQKRWNMSKGYFASEETPPKTLQKQPG